MHLYTSDRSPLSTSFPLSHSPPFYLSLHFVFSLPQPRICMHSGLIIGAISMATIYFIFCTTTVLVALLLHHQRHKIKRERQTNVPTSTTNMTTTAAPPGITCTSNVTQRNCTAPMQQNVCYSASVIQENRETGGSYPYSYPYLSSTSLVDVSGVCTATEGRPNPQGMIGATAAPSSHGEIGSGGNVTMKQRSCDNEEDIYSYII